MRNLIKTQLLIFATILVAVFFQSSILLSPSHPFVDQNNNGIDDFEEGSGEYADPEVRAKIYGVEFPVAELDNCGSYYECRTFCEDPVNLSACVDYGKSKGFYQDEFEGDKKEQILEKAKEVFGCDSYETCRNFCEQPINYDACNSFATENNLIGGHVRDPSRNPVMEKAREILGCESVAECAAYCSDDTNRQKCTDFAKETGLRGGEHQVGPGGCTSEETCGNFCSNPQNFQVCSGFVRSIGGDFKGPGGCDSPDSCRTFCERNPANCGYNPPGGGVGRPPMDYNPEDMCSRTPACSWANNTCVCMGIVGPGGEGDPEKARQRAEEYAKFCRENPQRCTPGGIGGFESREDRATFERYCRDNPEGCRPAYYNQTGGAPYDPVIECSKYAGCAWTGNSCQCGTRYAKAADQNPEQTCKNGGCSWTGSGCDCSKSSYDSPALSCGRAPGCAWINSTCQCTYGAPTVNMPASSYSPVPASSGQGGYDPAAACSAAPGCSWRGSYCQCAPVSGSSGGGYYNPSAPAYVPQGYTAPTPGSGGYTPSSPGSYSGSGGGSYESPETACSRGGCSWNGSSCQCPSSGGGTTTYTPQSGYRPSTDYPRPSGYSPPGGYSGGYYSGSSSYTPPSSGGTYTPPSGSYTPPSSGSYTPPSSGSYTPPSSGGSYTPPSSGSYTPPAESYTPPSQPSEPAPQPQSQPSEPAPAPQPAQESAPAPAPTVQGVSTVRGIIQNFLDWLIK